MQLLIDYIIKLNICLTVVYLFYQLFLRRLTFYNWNRWYLVGYTALSFIIPLINIMPSLQRQQLQDTTVVQWVPVINFGSAQHNNFFESLSSWEWIVAAIVFGSFILLCRLVIRLFAFIKMKAKAQLLSNNKTKIYQLDGEVAPFSFGNAIFINTAMHEGRELEDIIRHEFVHVKQKHSIDIIWCELLCIINWFNPFVWFIRHNVRQNLEFLADDKVLQNGLDKKEYQYLLLKVIGNQQFAFTSHFNFSSLKKRIAMMNSMKSAKLNVTRFLFLLPVVAVLLLSFRNEMKEHNKKDNEKNNQIVGGVYLNNNLPDEMSIMLTEYADNDTMPTIKKNDTIIFFKNNVDTVIKQKPLYINDGVELDEKNSTSNRTVNPNDIEEINVLKGASAVSVYGEKGKNGVIQITTKRNTVPGEKLTLQNLGLDAPLYILNGKPVSEQDVKQLEPNGIASVNVLKGVEASTIYGPKAKNGVVMIVTKEPAGGNVIVFSNKDGQVKMQDGEIQLIADSILFSSKADTTISKNTNSLDPITKIGYKSSKNLNALESLPADVYYVLDGKHATAKQIKKLVPEDIESIDVLKGESAIKYYGKKAKKGAVVIVTK